MAQISMESIKKIDKYRNTVHEKVHTTYTVFEMDGERYVQLDTYGRIDRENPEKISQSFQFDRATARFLVNLFCEEFDLQTQSCLQADYGYSEQDAMLVLKDILAHEYLDKKNA